MLPYLTGDLFEAVPVITEPCLVTHCAIKMNHTKFKVKVEVIDYWLLVVKVKVKVKVLTLTRTFNAKIEKNQLEANLS